MKIKTKKGARRIRNQKVRVKGFTQVISPINGYQMAEGEVFKVTNLKPSCDRFKYTFDATNGFDGTVLRTCLQKECEHIEGNDWIIVPIYK